MIGPRKIESCVVTGGCGFIGSHLVEHLLREGVEVTVVDDLSTGKLKNLEHLEDHARLNIVLASCDDLELMQNLIRAKDFVYHFASAVGVKLIMRKPVQSIHNIYSATETVLQVCNRFRVPMMLASSSEVYGASDKIPFSEEASLSIGSPAIRRWSYACGKALNEFYAMAYHQDNGLPVQIARLFNTCGPRQRGHYGMVMPSFVQSALRNDPLLVYGDGKQERCFCSVYDVVRAIYQLSCSSNCDGEIFNVGSADIISINDLAALVVDLTESGSAINHVPYKSIYGPNYEDTMKRQPDISKIREFIGWEPEYSLEKIIKTVIKQYENNAML